MTMTYKWLDIYIDASVGLYPYRPQTQTPGRIQFYLSAGYLLDHIYTES
jgi:hypothetical protein